MWQELLGQKINSALYLKLPTLGLTLFIVSVVTILLKRMIL